MEPLSVEAVLTGRSLPLRGDELSAIRKEPEDGPIEIGMLGLIGDEQADLRVHGGPDKAVHHYPRDHYAFWESLSPFHSKLDHPGAFGENIAVSGMVETEVCIGDRYRLGTALVEISQGRQPCWKQAHVMEWPELVSLMVKHHLSGWYYRVIEPGRVAAGDTIALVDRPHPEWTVERVFGLLIGGGAKADTDSTRALCDLSVLAQEWRAKARKLSSA
ncbi:MOSC domain-containing protein [Parasphingopyxis sp. CP4]|uniref:MOSC domain-containing protein n=1 Tax=Parasphingopyxis sp. CP4 TaxID=2724527 RepID=UPI0015A0D72D|nr:MOSC domain-containing protein [Parasphingopyxis sp. CP4]QLC21774.1 MOSC domain-containing protein [Parasphingopyxis sp. CP4]